MQLRLTLALMALPLFAAEPTVEELKQQLAAEQVKVATLTQKLIAQQSRFGACLQLYNATDQLLQMEAQKPPDPPKPVEKPKQ